MKLRNRILLGSGLLILLPLLLLSFGIRTEMQKRLSTQYNERVSTLMAIIQEDLDDRAHAVRQRLANLHLAIVRDNDFRHAVVDDLPERPAYDDDLPEKPNYLSDYAVEQMGLMGFDMLQIQDQNDLIISSGHFPMEFKKRHDPGLPALLAGIPGGTALVLARQPQGAAFLALAATDSIRLGARQFHILGGIGIDTELLKTLTRDRELAISLVYRGGVLSSDAQLQDLLSQSVGQAGDHPERILIAAGHFVQTHDLTMIGDPTPEAESPRSRLTTARLIVTHPGEPLQRLVRDLNLWLGLAAVVTLIGSFWLAFWASRRISRPLDELAQKTADLDLDRLDTDFATERSDEIGMLSRLLAEMTGRLRSSVARLREVERRATIGEVARQVNHDIRNGITPVRNVVRHLSELATEKPEQLATIFQQRQQTLTSGLSYLEDLATNYARLSTTRQRTKCNLNSVVSEAIAGLAMGDTTGKVELVLSLMPQPPLLLTDPVGLRRIVDNLVRNASESLPDSGGTITVTTSVDNADTPANQLLVLTVGDTGCGIESADLDRIFTDFFTTKVDGTGLGLSNVRRLVTDCEGSIRVASKPGQGSIFTISFPTEEYPT